MVEAIERTRYACQISLGPQAVGDDDRLPADTTIGDDLVGPLRDVDRLHRRIHHEQHPVKRPLPHAAERAKPSLHIGDDRLRSVRV